MLGRLPQAVTLAVLAALLEAAFLALRRLQPLHDNTVEAIAVGLIAGAFYLLAVFCACAWPDSRRGALAVVLLAAAVFRATLLPLPPSLSDDLYRYRWEGALQRVGYNPYLLAPEQLPPDDPLRRVMPAEVWERLPGPDLPTAYGPLAELLFRLVGAADGVLAFKSLSVLFDLATLGLIVLLLRRRGQPAVRALIYGWSPLVVLEFAGSGHNDSMVLFGLVLACYLLVGRRSLYSAIGVAVATLAKWVAAPLALLFLRHAGWPRERRGWWALGLFVGTAAAVTLPYAGAGLSLFSGLFGYAAQWRNNASLWAALHAITGEEAIASGLGLGVIGALALHFAWQKTPPLRACLVFLAALLFLSPSVFPWYVTWPVPFLCFYPNPALLLFSVTVLLSYHVLIDFTASGAWHYTPWLVWLEYAPVFALLLWTRLRAELRWAARR